jgi:hypothetical protein
MLDESHQNYIIYLSNPEEGKEEKRKKSKPERTD